MAASPRLNHARFPSAAAGEPRKALLGGIKYDRKELLPITAYRCPQCGRVELYAPSEDEQDAG